MRMTRTAIVALCMLTGGIAAAQPDPLAGEPTAPPTPPVPPMPPMPPKPAPPRAIEAAPEMAKPSERPTAFSLGIGAGYRFPVSLQMPNITSVRLRIPNGVTLEPTLVLATTSHTQDVGTSRTGSSSEFGVGALVRVALVEHGRTDLELLGGLHLDRLSTDPDTSNPNDVKTVSTVELQYGVAVGTWITPHLQVSMSATNGLVTYVNTREEMGIDTVTVTKDSTFGLIFDPTVALMVHFYN